jgi:hypothetical protein
VHAGSLAVPPETVNVAFHLFAETTRVGLLCAFRKLVSMLQYAISIFCPFGLPAVSFCELATMRHQTLVGLSLNSDQARPRYISLPPLNQPSPQDLSFKRAMFHRR